MRVWIISDKRYGNSNESHWIAEISHDPNPGADPDESVWDRVQYRGKRCATKDEALAVAAKLKSNVCNAAQVFERRLEQIEGSVYDWTIVSEPIEVECIYVASKAVLS
jgi:hypothetical protein